MSKACVLNMKLCLKNYRLFKIYMIISNFTVVVVHAYLLRYKIISDLIKSYRNWIGLIKLNKLTRTVVKYQPCKLPLTLDEFSSEILKRLLANFASNF